MRGSWPPNACAASGATADTNPMPNVKLTKKTVCASDAAAIASLPRRPMKAISVVIIAICPSCVSANGTASLSVSASSSVRWPGADARGAIDMGSILSREVMTPDYYRRERAEK